MWILFLIVFVNIIENDFEYNLSASCWPNRTDAVEKKTWKVSLGDSLAVFNC